MIFWDSHEPQAHLDGQWHQKDSGHSYRNTDSLIGGLCKTKGNWNQSASSAQPPNLTQPKIKPGPKCQGNKQLPPGTVWHRSLVILTCCLIFEKCNRTDFDYRPLFRERILYTNHPSCIIRTAYGVYSNHPIGTYFQATESKSRRRSSVATIVLSHVIVFLVIIVILILIVSSTKSLTVFSFFRSRWNNIIIFQLLRVASTTVSNLHA